MIKKLLSMVSNVVSITVLPFVSNKFSNFELRCHCCGELDINPTFLRKLNRARAIAGISFRLSSAYRCKSKNDSLPNSSPTSAHMSGYAVDIVCTDMYKRAIIVISLILAGFNRIGISDEFIHVDCSPDKNAFRIWVY